MTASEVTTRIETVHAVYVQRINKGIIATVVKFSEVILVQVGFNQYLQWGYINW